MILIAHRGNIDGPNPEKENHPDYIINAISEGYDSEIDIWYKDGKIFLGHDNPQYEIDKYFLLKFKEKLWCHAKNSIALKKLIDIDMHCFFHNTDDVVLTSKKYLWTYPGKELVKGSISVMPEINNDNTDQCIGICSDLIGRYKTQ